MYHNSYFSHREDTESIKENAQSRLDFNNRFYFSYTAVSRHVFYGEIHVGSAFSQLRAKLFSDALTLGSRLSNVAFIGLCEVPHFSRFLCARTEVASL
jgi:hypothetical protein